jgi:hypothetical protein
MGRADAGLMASISEEDFLAEEGRAEAGRGLDTSMESDGLWCLARVAERSMVRLREGGRGVHVASTGGRDAATTGAERLSGDARRSDTGREYVCGWRSAGSSSR